MKPATIACVLSAALLSCDAFPTKLIPVCDGACAGDMRPPDMSHQPCKGNGDCASTPVAPLCGPSGVCVECVMLSDCTKPTAPACTSNNTCGNCSMASDCSRFSSTPLCNTTSGGCVQCLTKNDCDAQHLTCDTSTNKCKMCSANSDCTSGLCNTSTGMCVDKSTLLYVNNSASPACSDTGACLFTQPCCTVQKGLNTAASTAKTVIVFAGQGYAEALTASPAQNGGNDYVATAVGVSGPQIKPSTGAVLTISGLAAKQVTLSLDGFTFDGTNATDGVKVAGDNNAADYAKTQLMLKRSTVQNSPTVGVTSSANCTLTLDADTITGNKGGGISVDATNFAVTNLVVVGNGTTSSNFGGISIGTNAGTTMSLANLTLVSNKARNTALASGIACNVSATLLENVVIFGDQMAGRDINVVQCGTPTTSAYYGAADSGNTKYNTMACTSADQLFMSASTGDYRPNKTAVAPCPVVLVGVGTQAGAPTTDFAGITRPNSPSVGAYEPK